MINCYKNYTGIGWIAWTTPAYVLKQKANCQS